VNVSLIACLAAMFLVQSGLSAAPTFAWHDNRLQVRTAALEVAWEQGVITAVTDRRTGEVFSRARPADFLAEIPWGSSTVDDWSRFVDPYGQKRPAAGKPAGPALSSGRLQPGLGSHYRFRQRGPDEAEIVVDHLPGGASGDELIYRISVEKDSGEVVLQVTSRRDPAGKPPLLLEFPLLGFTGKGVILSSGAFYARGEPPQWEYAVRWANNLSSPRMAIVEGQLGCLAVWADRPHEPGNLVLAHDPACDHIILRAERSALRKDPAELTTTTWRLGAFPAWPAAARRYRCLFEKATGARLLWENRCRWTRSIHAVCTEMPNSPAEAEAFYTKLAGWIEPHKLLLFYWNGDRIVLFGDHRYLTHMGRPRPEAITALKKRGFRWLGYHPYVLVFSPRAMKARLDKYAAKGEVPAGYQFTPDYDGPPQDFPEYFRSVATGYYRPLDEAELWVIHPGSRLGRQYLVRNFSNYCRFHQMDGAYFDILGADHGYMYLPQKQVFEGLDYRGGEYQVLADIARHDPELAVMSEVESEWTLAHTFYTWEGESHFSLPRAHASIRARFNHPLRTALWGSYAWTREEELEADESALVGALPRLRIGDEWSVVRAKLFAEEELYNDLPPSWDPEALACYRARGGRWVQYRRLPFGEGFVEMTSQGPRLRLGVLRGPCTSPLAQPVRVAGWIAYHNGRPIGLDPQQRYPFVLEAPVPETALWVTQVPPGVSLSAVRNMQGFDAIELRNTGKAPPSVEIGVRFHRRCLRVLSAAAETVGPWEAGQAAVFRVNVPGGLVFVGQEPVALKTPQLEHNYQRSHILPRGTLDSFWCFNSAVYQRKTELGGRELAATIVGPGRFRGYADFWVEIPAAAHLKLEVGYPSAEGKKRVAPRPLRFGVRVNGHELWAEQVASAREWQAREVSLAPFAGRKVLISLTAEAADDVQRKPSPTDVPALFGDVRLEIAR
jgi:hypothetical protein